MGFDERDLRRALSERSAAPTREFRARLSAAALEGPRGGSSPGREALAGIAAAVLAIVAVGVLVGPRLLPPAASPADGARDRWARAGAGGPGESVASIQFLTPSLGSVLAGGALYATADGGAHWQRQVDPALGAGGPPLDHRLSYVDQRRGVIFGSAGELRTVDGGAHWVPVSTPFRPDQVRSISFLASGEGWALVGGSPASQCASERASTWHTTDLGLSWTAVPALLPEARCKTEISFRDPQHGWIVTAARNGPPQVLATADGGATWRQVALEGPAAEGGLGERRLHIPVMFDARNGVLPAVEESSGAFGYYRTADGGATWGPYTRVALAAGRSGAYHLADASRWWVSAGPVVAATANGGATWTAADLSALGVTSIAELDVVTPRTAWALGMRGELGVLLRSEDGGAHWREVPLRS